MKYGRFLSILDARVNPMHVGLGPCINIWSNKWEIEDVKKMRSVVARYVVIPVKIYYSARGLEDVLGDKELDQRKDHLNVLVMDKKSKTVERYEPNTRRRVRDARLDSLIKDALSEMRLGFVEYSNSTWATEHAKTPGSCVEWCVKYILHKTG